MLLKKIFQIFILILVANYNLFAMNPGDMNAARNETKSELKIIQPIWVTVGKLILQWVLGWAAGKLILDPALNEISKNISRNQLADVTGQTLTVIDEVKEQSGLTESDKAMIMNVRNKYEKIEGVLRDISLSNEEAQRRIREIIGNQAQFQKQLDLITYRVNNLGVKVNNLELRVEDLEKRVYINLDKVRKFDFQLSGGLMYSIVPKYKESAAYGWIAEFQYNYTNRVGFFIYYLDSQLNPETEANLFSKDLIIDTTLALIPTGGASLKWNNRIIFLGGDFHIVDQESPAYLQIGCGVGIGQSRITYYPGAGYETYFQDAPTKIKNFPVISFLGRLDLGFTINPAKWFSPYLSITYILINKKMDNRVLGFEGNLGNYFYNLILGIRFRFPVRSD